MKQRLLILGLVLGLICLLALLFVNNTRFRLTGTTPKLGGTIATSTGVIELRFSEELDSSINYMERISGEDFRLVKSADVKDRTIFLYLDTVTKDRRYKFELKDIRSKTGETIARVPINFQGRYVAFSKLSDSQKKLEVSKTDRATAQDPILQYLPYQGDGIYVTSEFTANEEGEDILVINAQLFLKRSDLGANRTQALQTYKKRVEDFIRSKGLDPANYYIRHIINEPPATAN